MFRVYPPPIIRSTKLYLQHLVFVKPLLLPAAIAAGSSSHHVSTGLYLRFISRIRLVARKPNTCDMPLCPSVRLYQHGFQWTDFLDILY